MFGWQAKYIRKTRARVETVQIDGRTKAITPRENRVPCEPFLPYLRHEEPTEPVKARYKRKVFHCMVDGEGFYLKKYSYRITNRHYAWLRGFIWTIPLAQRQFHKMFFLRQAGAQVAEPVMALVRRYGWFKKESMLVMRECPGVLLKEYMREVEDFHRRLNILAQTFRFLGTLHSIGIHHGDMTSHNFIITPDEEIRAIDLDERKTKWLGSLGNRKEMKKWVRRAERMLGIEGEPRSCARVQAFERMLEENAPSALRFW